MFHSANVNPFKATDWRAGTPKTSSKNEINRDSWVAQSVQPLTLDPSPGLDLRGLSSSHTWGPTLGREPT